jgi:hypothetical protein
VLGRLRVREATAAGLQLRDLALHALDQAGAVGDLRPEAA